MKPNKSHGGARKGAGRKPTSFPEHTKKFRASEKDWNEFLSYLTGDARHDFVVLFDVLRLAKRGEMDAIAIHNELTGRKNER